MQKVKNVINFKDKLQLFANEVIPALHPRLSVIKVTGDKVVCCDSTKDIKEDLVIYDYMELCIITLNHIFSDLEDAKTVGGISGIMMYFWVKYDLHPVDFTYDVFTSWYGILPSTPKLKIIY